MKINQNISGYLNMFLFGCSDFINKGEGSNFTKLKPLEHACNSCITVNYIDLYGALVGFLY